MECLGGEMSSTIYFAKACPACGRTVQIKLFYLGQQVRCVHCNREFTATDPHSESAAIDDPVQYWLNFTANESLEFSELSSKPQFRNPR